MLEIDWEKVPPENIEHVRSVLEEMGRAIKENPLIAFAPHPPNGDGHQPQMDFLRARTPIIAAFAGNRFGKSTVLTACALRECLDREALPALLRDTKRFSPPVDGWILVPSEDKVFDSFEKAFRKWTPSSAFEGGSWGKAYNGQARTLRFSNGSTIAFKTYKQDPSTLGGAAVHFVGYDEPPPKAHREECMMRLPDYGGYEMFAMTPLKANTGYVRREIWKNRESPDITVVRGSIYDNPHLDRGTVDRVLGSHNDLWRRAREFGDFVDVGGLIYPEFERCVADDPFDPAFIRGLDIVVAIDPGIRNCGIVFTAFDRDNGEYVFDELLLQDSTPAQYAEAIRRTLARWGIKEDEVQFVTDPAARQRGQVNAETVMSALVREQIYCNAGQNDVEAGIGQLRIRMQHGRFHVNPTCVGLRDEADDYAAEEPDEGRDNSHLIPIKGNDHRLDALRYATMERFWDPVFEEQAPQRNLGWRPGEPVANLAMYRQRETEPAPMGFLG